MMKKSIGLFFSIILDLFSLSVTKFVKHRRWSKRLLYSRLDL